MKMKTTWLITLDRFGNETVAKGGDDLSITELCDRIVAEYKAQKYKPRVIISSIGIGTAAYYCLREQIPVEQLNGILHRIGNSDVMKFKSSILEDNNEHNY